MKKLLTVVCAVLCAAAGAYLFAQDSQIAPQTAAAQSAPQTAAASSGTDTGIPPELAAKSAQVKQAIRAGDCSYLYNFTLESTEPDGGTEAENKLTRALVGEAIAGLRSYTQHDRVAERYQTGRIDQHVRDVPAVMMSQVFSSPEAVLPQVVSVLLNHAPTLLSKVKVMHDWICDNIAYDYEMAASGKIEGQEYAQVLQKKKAVCVGYSNLLKKMCDIAGIEALVIEGSLKSKDYGWTGKLPSGDHAWNSVFINNKWYLVDATLDAGFVVNMKAFVRRYSTEYLFLDSRPFLYTHFPKKTELQYYGPALSAAAFEQEAAVPGAFFQYGLSLDKDAPYDNTQATNGVYRFNIYHSKLNVNIISDIQGGEVWLEDSTEKGVKTTAASYLLPTPPAGNYQCSIKARYNDEKGFPLDVDAGKFENEWMERVTGFRKANQISPYELLTFRGSYMKVESAGKYYFVEDPLDAKKTAAIYKINRLLEQPVVIPRTVLEFNLQGK
ncbi:MAG: hypothetical protein LBG72_00175 [Spirochaetaceae bacterium]|jgi:hypothetical protein|nr:hypothetical protein [Spirochaetaceae bacterium]